MTLPDIDQDLYLNGDIINEAGAVKIKNVEGSIFVNGEIRGATVELFAARDFNLNTEGLVPYQSRPTTVYQLQKVSSATV